MFSWILKLTFNITKSFLIMHKFGHKRGHFEMLLHWLVCLVALLKWKFILRDCIFEEQRRKSVCWQEGEKRGVRT